jgi:hypothetical protein
LEASSYKFSIEILRLATLGVLGSALTIEEISETAKMDSRVVIFVKDDQDLKFLGEKHVSFE